MLIWSSGQKLNEMATSFLVEFQFLLFKKGCWVTFETCLGVSPIIKDAHICLVSCLVRFWTRLEHTCYYWLIFYFILIFMFFLDSTRGITNISFLVVFLLFHGVVLHHLHYYRMLLLLRRIIQMRRDVYKDFDERVVALNIFLKREISLTDHHHHTPQTTTREMETKWWIYLKL